MPDKAFVDTNVWVYLFVTENPAADTVKSHTARATLETASAAGMELVVSVQVLNEFANVLRRKFQFSPAEIRARIEHILDVTEAISLTTNHTLAALDLMEKYRLSWFDALILATALDNNCTIIYSEDLQDGLLLEQRMRVINPFSARIPTNK
jgi:predicted nucleic acid-binding protein